MTKLIRLVPNLLRRMLRLAKLFATKKMSITVAIQIIPNKMEALRQHLPSNKNSKKKLSQISKLQIRDAEMTQS